jgi:hypothetical protein
MTTPICRQKILIAQSVLKLLKLQYLEVVAQNKELKVWNRFIHLPYRHTFDCMPVLPERLLDPRKNLPLSAILLRVTEKHPAFG